MLAQRPAHLVVDLAALTIIGARVLTVLGQAGDTALGCGTGYAVAGALPRINQMWSMGWTDAERPIGFPTVAEVSSPRWLIRSGSKIGPGGNPST